MRFKYIEIKNYRQYIDERFDFELKYLQGGSASDLHIIIAENGVGKSNILGAINWCLYGEEYNNEFEEKLPLLNLAVLKQAEENNKKTEKISVKIVAENYGKEYSFEREAEFIIESKFQKKDVFKVCYPLYSGDIHYCNEDEAKDCVKKYMPEEIKQYFYFDGEQLHNYFFGAQSQGEKIKSSIKNISQVHLITRISQKLAAVVKGMRREAGNKNPQIKLINTQIEDLQNEIKEKNITILDLEKNICLADEKIQEYSQMILGYDNLKELEEKRNQLKQNLESINENIRELNKESYIFARDMKIAFALYDACKNSLDLILDKEKKNELPPNIDKNLLMKTLTNKECCICHSHLKEDDLDIIKQLIEDIQISNGASRILIEIKSTLLNQIQKVKNYKQKRDSIVKRLTESDKLKDACCREFQNIQDQLNNIPNTEVIKLAIEDREKQENLKRTNLIKIGTLKEWLKNSNDRLNHLKDSQKKALKDQEDLYQLNKNIELAQKAEDLTIEVENEIMQEIKVKIEKRATEIYKELLWKENTYEQIKLNESYQLSLYHVEGYSCINSCSAAEKALLALSFTLALQEISGFNNLLFIDTPVARTSGEHRKNFAKVLSSVSKHKQIIMMFTKDEYSDEIRSIFDKEKASLINLLTNERETSKCIQ